MDIIFEDDLPLSDQSTQQSVTSEQLENKGEEREKEDREEDRTDSPFEIEIITPIKDKSIGDKKNQKNSGRENEEKMKEKKEEGDKSQKNKDNETIEEIELIDDEYLPDQLREDEEEETEKDEEGEEGDEEETEEEDDEGIEENFELDPDLNRQDIQTEKEEDEKGGIDDTDDIDNSLPTDGDIYKEVLDSLETYGISKTISKRHEPRKNLFLGLKSLDDNTAINRTVKKFSIIGLREEAKKLLSQIVRSSKDHESIERAIFEKICQTYDEFTDRVISKYKVMIRHTRTLLSRKINKPDSQKEIIISELIKNIEDKSIIDYLHPHELQQEEEDFIKFISKPPMVEEGAYECRKCLSKKVVKVELQVRSSDEPSTIFLTCVQCQNRWRIG